MLEGDSSYWYLDTLGLVVRYDQLVASPILATCLQPTKTFPACMNKSQYTEPWTANHVEVHWKLRPIDPQIPQTQSTRALTEDLHRTRTFWQAPTNPCHLHDLLIHRRPTTEQKNAGTVHADHPRVRAVKFPKGKNSPFEIFTNLDPRSHFSPRDETERVSQSPSL